MAQVKTGKSASRTTSTKRSPKVVTPAVKRGSPLAHGVGRRKMAIARVWLRRGNGALVVNGKDYKHYFNTDIARNDAVTACKVVPSAQSFDIEANIYGGGAISQAGALRLGIARARVAHDETLRSLLRQHDLLTVDARRKERKKYGQKAARRKFQFVKR